MSNIPDRIESPDNPVRLLVLPIWILAIYFGGSLIVEASTIFLWIVCSFFLFVLLEPTGEWLKSKRWPGSLAALTLVIAATALTGAAIYFLGTLFSKAFYDLEQSKKILIQAFHSSSDYWHQWSDKVNALISQGGGGGGGDEHVQKVEVVQSSPIGGEFTGTIMHGLGSAATAMTFALLVPILAFFFLAERDTFAGHLGRAYKNKARGPQVWTRIVQATHAFFLGNLVLAVVTYPVFTLLFYWFGVPSIFTSAALATVFNLIPFMGAVLSGLFPAVALYSQQQVLGASFGLYACCIAIHFIIADFVTPKILGSQVNINATTSTIALVAWGELWGGIGLILAIPLTALIKTMFEYSDYFWLMWLADLMSEGEKKPRLKKLTKGKHATHSSHASASH